MPGQPPIALLGNVGKALDKAGYPKTLGSIQKRLEIALAERGHDAGLQKRCAEFIRERRSEIEWVNETWSPAVRAARADEVDKMESFMLKLLGVGVIFD